MKLTKAKINKKLKKIKTNSHKKILVSRNIKGGANKMKDKLHTELSFRKQLKNI